MSVPTLYISTPVTRYTTSYVPSLAGIVTYYYSLVMRCCDENGEEYVDTEIVSAVTVPLETRGKSVVVPISDVGRRLRRVALRSITAG